MPETSKENVVAILQRAKLEGWVLGTTKVMMMTVFPKSPDTKKYIYMCVPACDTVTERGCQVFLRYYHVEQLNLLLREVIARVVVMQAYTKGWLGARRYRREKEKRSQGATVIQSGTQPVNR